MQVVVLISNFATIGDTNKEASGGLSEIDKRFFIPAFLQSFAGQFAILSQQ